MHAPRFANCTHSLTFAEGRTAPRENCATSARAIHHAPTGSACHNAQHMILAGSHVTTLTTAQQGAQDTVHAIRHARHSTSAQARDARHMPRATRFAVPTHAQLEPCATTHVSAETRAISHAQASTGATATLVVPLAAQRIPASLSAIPIHAIRRVPAMTNAIHRARASMHA